MCALLAVPNFSEGRDQATVDAIAAALTRDSGVRLLDLHSDADHNRSVYTLTGGPTQLAAALYRGAREAINRIDLGAHAGAHPYAGALDVAPIVFTQRADAGAASAAALLGADVIAHELNLPVFLYGSLSYSGLTRAALRNGGPRQLAERIRRREQVPEFGPRYGLHPTAGATLMTARPPLIAFNVEVDVPLGGARELARVVRRLPGVVALGIQTQTAVQVSTNIEQVDGPAGTRTSTPAEVVATVRAHAPVTGAELVGLAPREAFTGWRGPPVRNLRFIEDLL